MFGLPTFLAGDMERTAATRLTKRLSEAEWPIPQIGLPISREGRFTVEGFSVSVKAAENFNLKQLCNGYASRAMKPGKFIRLVEHGDDCGGGGCMEAGQRIGECKIWMSDTFAELTDHVDAVEHSGARNLVHGLGLGAVVNALILKDGVREVEVWEKEIDVINLVGPYYHGLAAKHHVDLTIKHGDVWDHRPKKGERWDMVWHDIWPMISDENLKPMQRLTSRFRNRCTWQGCWAIEECRKFAKEIRALKRDARRGVFHW